MKCSLESTSLGPRREFETPWRVCAAIGEEPLLYRCPHLDCCRSRGHQTLSERAHDPENGREDPQGNQVDATDKAEHAAVDDSVNLFAGDQADSTVVTPNQGANGNLSDEMKKRIAAKREAAVELRRQRKLLKRTQDAASSADGAPSPGLAADTTLCVSRLPGPHAPCIQNIPRRLVS